MNAFISFKGGKGGERIFSFLVFGFTIFDGSDNEQQEKKKLNC